MGCEELCIDKGIPLAKVRPVFYEELNLFGFNKYWEYPECEEPLLWRVNRTYYYDGRVVGRIDGDGFYEKPIANTTNRLKLEPIDIDAILERNRKIIDDEVREVKKYIRETKNRYKDYFAVVGFSGGKDSTVLLSLVADTLASDEFIVLFNDTSMEMRANYEYVKKVSKMYSWLRFYEVRHEVPAIEFWKQFGVPSRIHRWCCFVYKMLPTIKFLKESGHKKILFYDGIRGEESPKRARMDKETEGKNYMQINVHPILGWNSAMVWLYIFDKELPINPLYRYGLNRIGCIVCPYESGYGEMIIGNGFMDEAREYISLIEEYAKKRGVQDIEKYITDGNWKVRVSGEYVSKSKICVISDKPLTMIFSGRMKTFFEWIKTLGEISVDGSMVKVLYKGKMYAIVVRETKNGNIFIKVLNGNKKFNTAIKYLVNKVAYCVRCGVCGSLCSSDAIKYLSDSIEINGCVHCGRCLKVEERGCLRADSMKIPYVKAFGENLEDAILKDVNEVIV